MKKWKRKEKGDHFHPKAWAHSTVSSALGYLTRTLSDVEVTGLEHIPQEGGAIIIANHRSYFHAPALASVLHQSKRDTMVFAKVELFQNGLMGSGLHSCAHR